MHPKPPDADTLQPMLKQQFPRRIAQVLPLALTQAPHGGLAALPARRVGKVRIQHVHLMFRPAPPRQMFFAPPAPVVMELPRTDSTEQGYIRNNPLPNRYEGRMARKSAAPPKAKKAARRHAPALHATADMAGGTEAHDVGGPQFSQPEATPDPTKFTVKHASDNAAYKQLDKLAADHKLRPMGFPAPRGGTEPVLTLAEMLGPAGPAIERAITAAGQLVFHSVGDTGSTRGPKSQNEVADKMTADFTDEASSADHPQFFFHLGDVIYSFGEAAYYYDQFYDPYRNYPAPIFALAGNHDGMVAPGTDVTTLAAFLQNFCAESFLVTPEAGGLNRTAQIQPGVFFTFEAPLLRILCLYSNVLEDPGIISSQDGTYPELGDSQLDYLAAALKRVAAQKFAGALIIAHHHPAYTAGSKHGWSEDMRAQIDAACEAAGVWPHAVLSAHAHNYQRFTRSHGDTQIPYIIAGNGGHGLARLTKKGGTGLRTPLDLPVADGEDPVTLESYDDQDYGYLRIVVTAEQLTIEYHPASDGDAAKTPDDSVTVDLATRTLVA